MASEAPPPAPPAAKVPAPPPELAANVPAPPSERHHLLVALLMLAVGIAALALLLGGAWRRSAAVPAPPPVGAVTSTPASGATAGHSRRFGAIVARPPAREQRADRRRFDIQRMTHISAAWESGFYPLYATAAHAFGLNWLLIASVHKQETAFSTAPSTYRGLNFAGCCGGPMQFNVTNKPVSTWDRVSDSYRYALRPAVYNRRTARHPSIYDDFDAVMAGARLLWADGARIALDASAWQAAYDYYGHDPTGVTYADQVLARAIGWSQHGFCINCALDGGLVAAVHAAYGAPVMAVLTHPAHHAAKREVRALVHR